MTTICQSPPHVHLDRDPARPAVLLVATTTGGPPARALCLDCAADAARVAVAEARRSHIGGAVAAHTITLSPVP